MKDPVHMSASNQATVLVEKIRCISFSNSEHGNRVVSILTSTFVEVCMLRCFYGVANIELSFH